MNALRLQMKPEQLPAQTCRTFHTSSVMWITHHRQSGCNRLRGSPGPKFRGLQERRRRDPDAHAGYSWDLGAAPNLQTQRLIQALRFCFYHISGHILMPQVYLSTFTKVFSSHLMPRVHEWSNDDKFRKITKQKCQWSKTDERPWDADPSLSPRLTQHLWLVQESQAQGTDNQTSQIAPNHNPFGVVGNGLTLRGVRLWVLKFSVSDEGTLMPLGILLP